MTLTLKNQAYVIQRLGVRGPLTKTSTSLKLDRLIDGSFPYYLLELSLYVTRGMIPSFTD